MKLYLALLLCIFLMAQPAVAQNTTKFAVVGKVVTQDGTPVQGFPVIVTNERDGQAQQHIAVTGSDGTYLFEGLEAGDYSVKTFHNSQSASQFRVPLAGR